jgi:hypothetical protein
MPEKHTAEKAKRKLRSGRSTSTAAGELVREEIHHVRRGKHGARSAKQAIAIGLSKARRAGIELPPPRKGRASKRTRAAARRARDAGQHRRARRPSPRRARATLRALRKEPRRAGSRRALAVQGRRGMAKRTHRERAASARKAARVKGPRVRRAAARKAARTRRAHAR